MRAREVQAKRFQGLGIYTNTMMSSSMLRKFCPLSPDARRLLDAAMERLQLSARAYDRIIKVARTIADLEGVEDIAICKLSGADVVRHRLVQKIIEAYEVYDKKHPPEQPKKQPPKTYKRG